MAEAKGCPIGIGFCEKIFWLFGSVMGYGFMFTSLSTFFMYSLYVVKNIHVHYVSTGAVT